MSDKYFNHYTVNTGHNRRSHRSEVDDQIIEVLKGWFEQMKDGEPLAIIDDVYSCQLLDHNSKMADFIIGYNTPDMKSFDVLRFVVCLHSRYKRKAWSIVEAEGEPLDAPFIAVRLINPELSSPELGDFERCMAWMFADAMSSKEQ